MIREIEILKNSTDTGWCLLAQGLQKGGMVFSSISVLEVSYMVAYIFQGNGFINPKGPFYLRKINFDDSERNLSTERGETKKEGKAFNGKDKMRNESAET